MRAFFLGLTGLVFVIPGAALAYEHTLFDSGHHTGRHIQPGETYEHYFDRVGTYTYHSSTREEQMRGTVLVYDGAPGSGTVQVEMRNDEFAPQQVEIRPRTTVIWTNRDSHNHSVSEDFDSPGPSEPPVKPGAPDGGGGKGLPAVPAVVLAAPIGGLALVLRRRFR